MRIGHAFIFSLVLSAILVAAIPALAADNTMRGLVVDVNDNMLWLGLPSAVKAGTVFEVRLLPESEPIAKAEVIECTADAPYVAKAKVIMLDKSVVIPTGAYVQPLPDAEVSVPETADKDFKEARNADESKLDFADTSQTDPFSFRVSAFFVGDNELRRETGDIWPSYELDYRVDRAPNYDSSIGISYYRRSASFNEKDMDCRRDFRVIPVTWSTRVPAPRSQRGGWFYRFALGAYFISDERTVADDTTKTSTATLGWKLGFGYESVSGRMAELTFVDAAKTEFNGLQFCLGARF